MKQFNDRDFLSSLRQFNTAIRYFSSDNTAERFLETVASDGGFDKSEMYNYFRTLIEQHRPDINFCISEKKEWKKLFNYVIKNEDMIVGKMLEEGMNFFRNSESLETYYRLVMKDIDVNPDKWITEYTLNNIGWRKILDTLLDTANKDYDSEVSKKKEESVEVTSTDKETEIECMESSKEKSIQEITEGHEFVTRSEHVHPQLTSERLTYGEEVQSIEPISSDLTLTSESITPKIKKKVSTGKRGYNQAVAAYKPVADFSSLEEAEKSTGVPKGEIKRCMESEIQTAGGFVWRRIGKKKDRLSQFEHTATYNNLVVAENITGINHSNISAVLKGKGNTAGGFVWIRVKGEKISSAPSTTSIDISPKKEGKSIKADSPSEKVLVAYNLTEQGELDFTKGQIGTFKTQAEAADFFNIPKTSISKYLKGYQQKLRWKKNESEKYWIGVRWESVSPPTPDSHHTPCRLADYLMESNARRMIA